MKVKLMLVGLVLSCWPMRLDADPTVNEAPAQMVWGGKDIATLRELAVGADLIAVGSIHRSRMGRLLPDGVHVETTAKLWIEEVIKGDVPAGGVVTVGQPGGRFPGEKGLVTTRTPSGHLMLSPGRRYVLFLRRASWRLGFEILGGPQGTFEARQTMAPHDERPGRMTWAPYRHMTLETFVAVTRRALR
jgi:hypothetical protein